jgi:hypothetical protein
MKQGCDHASANAFDQVPEFLWFTDADIAHSPDNLRNLVARAQSGDKVLVSLMARLSCKSYAEHFLIPAFCLFLRHAVSLRCRQQSKSPVAAAAGGCMLARRTALEKAGGLAAIRHNIIDDCALGRAMKQQGSDLAGPDRSRRQPAPYEHLSDIRQMVTRTAYAQLGYSPLVLAGTLLGLVMVYLAPVMTALFAWGISQMAGWIAWIIMAVMFQPILRFYRLSPLWGVALPVIGAVYASFTLQSALQHWSGKGGMWKGRPRRKRPGSGHDQSVAHLQSGKGHHDENFPVASVLIAPKHRPPVLAFYKFVRAADDVSDNRSAPPEEKLALLEQMRRSLVGMSDFVPEGVALRSILAERGLAPIMPWTCWKRSAATAPGCVTGTGTI